jgi:hypothetical protein
MISVILEVLHDTTVHENRLKNSQVYGVFMMIEELEFTTGLNFGAGCG